MFFLVIIEALIIYTNDHENMVLHATPSSMERETVTSCLFTTKGVLQTITSVTYTPTFPCSLYLPPSTPLIFNIPKSSRSFKYKNLNPKVGWRSATDWCQSRFTNFNTDPVSAKSNMLDDLDPPHIGNFRCGNCWDIFTSTFDLRRDASNTGIISLYRYGIKCIVGILLA